MSCLGMFSQRWRRALRVCSSQFVPKLGVPPKMGVPCANPRVRICGGDFTAQGSLRANWHVVKGPIVFPILGTPSRKCSVDTLFPKSERCPKTIFGPGPNPESLRFPPFNVVLPFPLFQAKLLMLFKGPMLSIVEPRSNFSWCLKSRS